MDAQEFPREAFRSIRELEMLLHGLTAPILKTYQLTSQQLELLMELDHDKTLTPAQLCERLGVQRPNLTPVLHKLALRGLIERHRNQHDKRSYSVSLTLDGRELMDEINAALAEIFFMFMASMPRDIFESVISGMYAIRIFIRGLLGQDMMLLPEGSTFEGEYADTDDFEITEYEVHEAVQDILEGNYPEPLQQEQQRELDEFEDSEAIPELPCAAAEDDTPSDFKA